MDAPLLLAPVPAVGATGAPAGRWPAVLFFFALVAASTRMLVSAGLHGNLLVDRYSPLLYQAATLGFNYFELGAVRRGLGGSLVHLLSREALLGTVFFHLLAAAAVSAGAALILARLDAPRTTRLAFACAALAIMLRWAEDAGRIDMAVAAFFAFATLAMAKGRLVAACACIGVGLFFHETSAIFGLPLIAALALRHGLARFTRRAWLGGASVLALALAAYVALPALPHASVATMVDVVRAKFAPHDIVDWAIYFAVSGRRGVETSICQNLTDPSYWVHPFGGLAVMAAVVVALSPAPRRDLPALALAALPPFVFLAVVANDFSRWTCFSAFNLWLVLASTHRPAARPWRHPALGLATALCVIPLTHPKPDKIDYPIYAGSPLIEAVARRLGGPRTPSVDEALQRCDPTWRQVLDPPSGASPEKAPAR